MNKRTRILTRSFITIALLVAGGCVEEYQSVNAADGAKLTLNTTAFHVDGSHRLRITLLSDESNCSISQTHGSIDLSQERDHVDIYVATGTRLYIKSVIEPIPFNFSMHDRTGSVYFSLIPEHGKDYTLEYKDLPDKSFIVAVTTGNTPVMLQSWSVCQKGMQSDNFNIGSIVKSIGNH